MRVHGTTRGAVRASLLQVHRGRLGTAAERCPVGLATPYDLLLGVDREFLPVVGGTLYGREAGPAELRRRLAGLTYVSVVSEPFALRSSWTPWNSTERAKLAVLDKNFIIREEYVRRGITLRLYVRRDEPRAARPAA